MTDVTTLHGDWTGLFSFVSAILLSTFILLFLPSSSVSLSNFYLAVPMRGSLGKHSCMSSPFPIAILNGTCSLRALILFCGDVPAIKAKLNKQTNCIEIACYLRMKYIYRLTKYPCVQCLDATAVSTNVLILNPTTYAY